MSGKLRIPVDKVYQRISMFFNGPNSSWTESHYINDSSGNPGANFVGSENMVQARWKMTSVDSNLLTWRSSILGRPKVFVSNQLVTTGNTANATAMNEVNDCIIAENDSGIQGGGPVGTYHSKIFLGGVPDTAITRNVYVVGGNPTFDSALQVFLSHLNGSLFGGPSGAVLVFGFLALSKEAGVAPKVNITNVTAAIGSAVVNVATAVAHMLSEGDIVRLSRIAGVSAALPLNQLWRVTSVISPTTFTVTLPAVSTAALSQDNSGTAWKQIYTWVPYGITWGRKFAATHRRGNTLFRPVGRRKIRRTVGY